MFGFKQAKIDVLESQVKELTDALAAAATTVRELRREVDKAKYHAPNYYGAYVAEQAKRIEAEVYVTGQRETIDQLKAALLESKVWRDEQLVAYERQHNTMLFAQQLMLTRPGMLANEALDEARIIYSEVK